MRMKLITRPYYQFVILQLAQVTNDFFDKEQYSLILRLKWAFACAVRNWVFLNIAALDRSSVRVAGFADGSFAVNHDLLSQLGHILFLLVKKIVRLQ